jgi:hypothetical protein
MAPVPVAAHLLLSSESPLRSDVMPCNAVGYYICVVESILAPSYSEGLMFHLWSYFERDVATEEK